MKYLIASVYNSVNHSITIRNEYIYATNVAECINEFYATHNRDYYAINSIIPLEDKTPLTKEILNKNFNIAKDASSSWYADNNITAYSIELPIRRTWNLLWHNSNNCLTIEDDPIIKMHTVNDLNQFLILSGINKEIII